jgi:hypothetical protein
MSNSLQALLIAAVLAFTGCEQRQSSDVNQVTLQERLIPHANPTNYEFDVTVSDVKDAIKIAIKRWEDELRRNYQGRVWKGDGDADTKQSLSQTLQLSGSASLLWKGDADSLAKGLLTKPGNENDAYVCGDGRPVGVSQTYFKAGQPLIYFADFHIHLTAASPQKTRVEVTAYESCVVAGLDKNWSPHGPSLISVAVEPTTIEEYQILLKVGEQLGTKNMPPLVTPGPDSPVRQLTKPRER